MIIKHANGKTYQCDYCGNAVLNPEHFDPKTELPAGWCEVNFLGVAIPPSVAQRLEEHEGALEVVSWQTCTKACAERIQLIVGRMLPDEVFKAETEFSRQFKRMMRPENN